MTTWGMKTMMTTQKNSIHTKSPKTEAEVGFQVFVCVVFHPSSPAVIMMHRVSYKPVSDTVKFLLSTFCTRR